MIPGMAGIAIPVLNAESDMLGSLVFVIPETLLTAEKKEFLIGAVTKAGLSLSESLARLGRARDSTQNSMITVKRSRPRAKRAAAHRPVRT